MKKYKIGYATGVFDMFNVGHLNFLRSAKEQCDCLVVGVSTDDHVMRYKQKKSVIPYEDRKTIVDAVRYVDKVVPQDDMDKFEAWNRLHFDVLFHGDDRKDSVMYDEVEQKLKAVGCDMVFLPYIEKMTSSMFKDRINLLTARPTQNGKIIGYTQGTFDLFHIGHLNLIKHAKEHCDYLIVGVNSDALVENYKNKHTVTGEQERAEIILGMSVVDECHVVNTLDKKDAYSKFHFNTIFIGDDWKGNARWEQTRMEMKAIGVDVKFLPHTDGISTTMLSGSCLNKIKE